MSGSPSQCPCVSGGGIPAMGDIPPGTGSVVVLPSQAASRRAARDNGAAAADHADRQDHPECMAAGSLPRLPRQRKTPPRHRGPPRLTAGQGRGNLAPLFPVLSEVVPMRGVCRSVLGCLVLVSACSKPADSPAPQPQPGATGGAGGNGGAAGLGGFGAGGS